MLNWPQEEAGPLAAGTWAWEYKGLHGTTPAGCRGIFRSRQCQPSMTGSRGIYGLAVESPSIADMAVLLTKLWVHNKFENGLAFELGYSGHQHIALRDGGVSREATEGGPEGDRLTHMKGEKGRWTWPRRFTSTRSLLVDPMRASAWVPSTWFDGPF